MTRVAVSKLYTRSLVEHLLFVWFSDDLFLPEPGAPDWGTCSLFTAPSPWPGVWRTLDTQKVSFHILEIGTVMVPPSLGRPEVQHSM